MAHDPLLPMTRERHGATGAAGQLRHVITVQFTVQFTLTPLHLQNSRGNQQSCDVCASVCPAPKIVFQQQQLLLNWGSSRDRLLLALVRELVEGQQRQRCNATTHPGASLWLCPLTCS
jgi:ferredoxin